MHVNCVFPSSKYERDFERLLGKSDKRMQHLYTCGVTNARYSSTGKACKAV